jgi:hypothetical protein
MFVSVRVNFVLFTCQDFSARLSVSKIVREILATAQAQFGDNPVWDPIRKDPRFACCPGFKVSATAISFSLRPLDAYHPITCERG